MCYILDMYRIVRVSCIRDFVNKGGAVHFALSQLRRDVV